MTTVFLLPTSALADWRVTSLALVMLIGPSAQAASIPPGGTQTITNADPIENWVLNQGSTLNAIGADTLNISATTATLNVTGAAPGRSALR